MILVESWQENHGKGIIAWKPLTQNNMDAKRHCDKMSGIMGRVG